MPRKDTTGPQGKGAGSGRRQGGCCVPQRGRQYRGFKGQTGLNSGRSQAGNQIRNQGRNSGQGRCQRGSMPGFRTNDE